MLAAIGEPIAISSRSKRPILIVSFTSSKNVLFGPVVEVRAGSSLTRSVTPHS